MKLAQILTVSILAVAAPAANAAYSLLPYQTYETGSWADAAAIGDIDGDGRNDVVLTTTGQIDEENDRKVFVFFQKPDGALDTPKRYSYLSRANATGLALADLDHDGRMEIIVGHDTGITILDWNPVRAPTPMRTRLYQTGNEASQYSVVAIDVNRDGALDVVRQGGTPGAVIYFGDGRGGIARQASPLTISGGRDLESGDFNGDGYDDIVVLEGFHAYVYYNDGSDDFSAPLKLDPIPDGGSTVDSMGSGDFNSDGREDLVIMRDYNSLSMYLQNAGGGFDPPAVLRTANPANAILGSDLDLDGRDDLIVKHGGVILGIYLQGATGLSEEAFFETPPVSWYNSQSLAAGDINSDACPDIVTATNGYGLIVHLGSGCHPIADLAPSLDVTTSVVTLQLANLGAADAAAPEAVVNLSVASGSLSIGNLPAGCILGPQTSRTSQVTCTGATLAAGASRDTLLPIQVVSGEQGDVLRASASVTTTSVELQLANNFSKQQLLLRPFVAQPLEAYPRPLSKMRASLPRSK